MLPHKCEPQEDIWPVLCNNPTNCWYLTGETIESLTELTHPMIRAGGRPSSVTFRGTIWSLNGQYNMHDELFPVKIHPV